MTNGVVHADVQARTASSTVVLTPGRSATALFAAANWDSSWAKMMEAYWRERPPAAASWQRKKASRMPSYEITAGSKSIVTASA